MPFGKIATFGLAAGVVLWAPEALAANSVGDIFSGGVKTAVVVIGAIVIALASLFAFLFATLIGNLMGSTYILDSGISGTMELVWIIMRNLTNYVILILVLVIALIAVLGVGGEKNDGVAMIREYIPKLVLALVAVNFTWFGARLVLTINDTLATAVFSLPSAVWQGETRQIPCGGDSKACLEKVQTTLTDKGSSYSDKLGGFMDTAFSKADAGAKNLIQRNNFSLALLSQMLDLKKIMSVNVQLNSAWGATVSTLGVMITTVITAFVFFFLLVAFITRMVVLWLLIAVAPLGVLLAIGKDSLKIPGLDQVDFMGTFMKNAFFPTAVAFPLSVGMIMIFTGNSFTGLGDTHTDALNAMLAGDIFAFLWWAAAIGVIWIGTKKTMETFAPIADGFVSGTHDFVNSIGKGAVGSLKYAPIFPVPGAAGPISIAGISKIGGLAEQRLNTASGDNVRGLATNIASTVRGEDLSKPPDTAAMNAALQETAGELGSFAERLHSLAASGGDLSGEITSSLRQKMNNGVLKGATPLAAGATFAEAARHLREHTNGHDTIFDAVIQKAKESGVGADGGKSGAAGSGNEANISAVISRLDTVPDGVMASVHLESALEELRGLGVASYKDLGEEGKGAFDDKVEIMEGKISTEEDFAKFEKIISTFNI